MVNTFIKGAAIHIEYLTHKFDGILILICCYESNDCGYCSLANMAVAFFNISFSSLSSCVFFIKKINFIRIYIENIFYLIYEDLKIINICSC